MKVLITGGYGFIGSHVADRFHKEGYDVFIIDNLSTGNRSNVTFSHKGYIIDVNDVKCDEIFRAHHFDVVVHLAAQVSVSQSVENPQLDANSNVAGLVNILNLSCTYKAKRFIYASSAAVYGKAEQTVLTESTIANPISPYGISKLANEIYGRKWEELYGLSTIGFRFSNVYGPRQNHNGEGGVVSIFINNLIQNKPLHVYGTGEQTRDFIYVEEVADVIFRSVNTTETGVYNLSTNTSTSVNDIIDTLKTINPDVIVKYEAPRKNDILHSRLDNSAIMKKLDWSPIYDFQTGLDKTYSFFLENTSEQEVAATKTIKKSKWIQQKEKLKNSKWVLPTFENLIAFVLTSWLTLNLATNLYAVIDIKLFYITIIGILYGNRQSLLSVLLSVGLLTYQELSMGRDLISLTYDTDYFFHIAVYLFVGLVVGYTIQRMKDRIDAKIQQKREIEDKYAFLESIYKEVREVKDELQYRILNSNDSYGKIYSITKELESLEPEIVFNSAVNVVKTIINSPKVTIYRVNKHQNFLRLLGSTGYQSGELKKSIRTEDHAYIKQVMSTGKLYTNKQFEPNSPLMAAPIFYNQQIAAIITIDGMPFENFSLYYQNLFQITINLIESALGRAFSYIEATESKRYFNSTQVLVAPVFKEILKSKNVIRDEHKVPYLLVDIIKPEHFSIEQVSEHISSSLRETDYIGLNESGDIQILFSNTSDSEFVFIKERLNHPNIELMLQIEE